MLEIVKSRFGRDRLWREPLHILVMTMIVAFLPSRVEAARPRSQYPELSAFGLTLWTQLQLAGPVEHNSPIGRVEVTSGESLNQNSGEPSRKLWPANPKEAVWVAFGFFGQMFFAARMLVQWIASERRKQSVLPVAFWWLSLMGGTILLIYFIRRREIIGVLGQFLPLIIYLRNLYFAYGVKKPVNIPGPGTVA
jgi:lipid-A-disaccharide synthase-like uncharacterized protein